MESQARAVDVVIAGGGMVGASLALALSALPLSIVLVEAAPAEVIDQAGYDDRAIALSFGSSQILQGMGVWEAVAAVANPISRIHVSDRGHFGATRLSAEQHNVPALGYLIEARRYSQVLKTLLDASNVELIQPAQIEAVNASSDHVEVTLSDQANTKLSSRLLVACDGANSAVREMAGVGATVKDYQQVAIIANVTTEMPHKNVAYERFTEHGPIALLPMSKNRCSLVWTVSPDEHQALLALDDQAFLDQLGGAFGYRLGRFTRVGRRGAFPLKLTESEQLIASRTVIIGNAAHTLHPVAGQGLNLALRDIADLGEQIAAAQPRDEDIGSQNTLEHYAEMRQRDTNRTIRYTDSLVKLFSNEQFVLGHARAAGLVAVDRLPVLRSLLAKQSMGISNRQSRLSRGLPLLKGSA